MPPESALPPPECADCPQLAELRQLVAALQQRVEELEQQAHRSAAPFRRPPEQRRAEKRKPGNKPGHAPAWRPPPPTIDEYAQVPLEACPHCAGPLTNLRRVEQILEEPVLAVRRLHLTTYRGVCPQCGEVRSTHPEQVSTAVGAAGVHLGRHALALAVQLNQSYGLTLRKTCRLLGEVLGLPLSAGGLSQARARVARTVEPAYDHLREQVRRSPVVHADETGWWLGGEPAWLWDFTNQRYTLYHLGRRNAEVVREQLGDDFAGVLVSDCLSAYDAHPGRKSKCVLHHLRAIAEAREQQPGSRFLREMEALWRGTLALHAARAELDPAGYAYHVTALEAGLDRLLGREYPPGPEQKIANRLRKQRPHLLTFLHVAGVDPTNNQAERQLRPAVIARKLSGGNKTAAGARTFEILASLAATCGQQGLSFSDQLVSWLRLGGPPSWEWT